MTASKGNNYNTGVVYSYTTTSLSPGVHYYRFRFDDSTDGSDIAIYEGDHSPAVSPLIVSHSSVSPTSAPGSTVFTFQTTYYDLNGEGSKRG